MNILEHIIAGNYPTDSKGRALVPMRNGNTLVVCATDRPSKSCIVGWRQDGNVDCWGYNVDSEYLLPPPPRKVEVKRWAEVRIADQAVMTTFSTSGVNPAVGCVLVELTGSYEEPWK